MECGDDSYRALSAHGSTESRSSDRRRAPFPAYEEETADWEVDVSSANLATPARVSAVTPAPQHLPSVPRAARRASTMPGETAETAPAENATSQPEEPEKPAADGEAAKAEDAAPEPEAPPEKEVRAVVLSGFGGINKVKVMRRSEPKPAEGEILVRVKACGLNFLDLMVRQGNLENPPKCPAVMGYECAGVVEALGEGVTGFEHQGEGRIFCQGKLTLTQRRMLHGAVFRPCSSVLRALPGCGYIEAHGAQVALHEPWEIQTDVFLNSLRVPGTVGRLGVTQSVPAPRQKIDETGVISAGAECGRTCATDGGRFIMDMAHTLGGMT
ncbi:Type I Polyketide synthase, partial [Branchiostoma belcheri]